MATKPRNQGARPMFRSLEEVTRHFQPNRADGDERESDPFAKLHQTLATEASRHTRRTRQQAGGTSQVN